MNDLKGLIAEGHLLLRYALTHNVLLDDSVRRSLSGADLEVLAAQPEERDRFLVAISSAGTAIGLSAAQIGGLAARHARLRPLIEAARTLLNYAAANGRKVDEEVRNTVMAIEAALDEETTTLEQEQAFLKAYESLTSTLAPITVETLDASTTKLPRLTEIFSRKGMTAPPMWTLGRFVNATIFILALAATGVSLAYYSAGSTALERFRELQASAQSLKQKEGEYSRDYTARDFALHQLEQSAKANPASVTSGQVEAAAALRDKSKAELAAVRDQQRAVGTELTVVPERMARWAMQPCESSNFIFKAALCSELSMRDRGRSTQEAGVGTASRGTSADPALEASSTLQVGTLVDVEAARTVVSRMSEVYLPLLLGFLGAHAFILRRMSREITEKTFAKGSAFNHIVRTGLGALAGLASTWLLTPEGIAGESLKALPTYALAFVAGYGIELVFAFMDRIISAFTTSTK